MRNAAVGCRNVKERIYGVAVLNRTRISGFYLIAVEVVAVAAFTFFAQQQLAVSVKTGFHGRVRIAGTVQCNAVGV